MLVYNYLTQTGDKKQISIELLNTPFVTHWIKYLDYISGRCPNIDWYFACHNNMSGKRPSQDNVYDLLKLRDSFNFINRNGLENLADEITLLERLMAFPERVEQKHLNKWHRIFTSLEYVYLKNEKKLPDQVDKKELWQYIQDINMYTHHMEMYTYHFIDRRKPYKDISQYSIQFTNANNLAYTKKENQVFNPNNIKWIDNYTFDIFNEDYNYTVWLHEDITGKDQMKAWLDTDNLNEFDITGNLLMTPSITLDPFYMYKSIFDDPNFKSESKRSNKSINRFPLGNIINLQSINWQEILKYNILNVSLYDKIIWPKEFI